MRSTKFVRLLSCLLPVAALALSACEGKDPTSNGSGAAALLDVSRSTTNQEVGRPFSISAYVRDVNGNRLAIASTAALTGSGFTLDSTVFRTETSETRFFLTPIRIDTTAFLVISAGSLTDTTFLRAYPGQLRVLKSSLPDTLLSGQTYTPKLVALSVNGDSLQVVPYKVELADRADSTKVFVNTDGTITARATGTGVAITFTGPGGALTTQRFLTVAPFKIATPSAASIQGGFMTFTITAPTGYTFTSATTVSANTPATPVVASRTATTLNVVVPYGTAAGTYTYTVTTGSGGPGTQILTGTFTTPAVAGPSATTAAGPNGSTLVVVSPPTGATFDNTTTITASTPEQVIKYRVTATSISAVIPFGTPAGTYTVAVGNLGTLHLSGSTSFTTTATAANDAGEPANDDPATAPAYSVTDTIVGRSTASDVDDYWTINVPADGIYNVTVNWTVAATDIDAYFLNASGALASCTPTNAAGDRLACKAATGARPETANTNTLTAGTYKLYINHYDGPSATYMVIMTKQ